MSTPPSDEDAIDWAALVPQLDHVVSRVVPHSSALGVRVAALGPAWAILRLPYDVRFVGNPETGVLHGGVVTSLIDAACGMATFMKIRAPRRIATLDLRIDYLKPAAPGRELLARAECYKQTRQVAFVRAVAYHDDPADPVAASAGTFMLFEEARTLMADALKGKQ